MRISGGSNKGRKLAAFTGKAIRPTPDKVRQAVFNITGSLGHEYKNILDIFAGTGAMGLEALSRSHLEEAHCVFVDSDPKAAEVIRKNIGTCKEEDRSEVLTADALKAISILANDKRTFELVVMDAPYNNEELTSKVLLALSKSSILSSEALIICETSLEVELQETQGLQLLKEKAYGDTKVSFFLKDKD